MLTGDILTLPAGHRFAAGPLPSMERFASPDDCSMGVSTETVSAARIVTAHSGLVGTWTAHASATDTTVAEVLVRQGETIDFIVECQANYTSDSFQWTVQIDRQEGAEATARYSSADAFSGPALSSEFVPGQVIRAWELAYARRPTPEELKLAFAFIQRQLDLIADQGIALPDGRSPVQQAMTNLCQALLTSNEFLYVD